MVPAARDIENAPRDRIDEWWNPRSLSEIDFASFQGEAAEWFEAEDYYY
jgi:hypothetical protein